MAQKLIMLDSVKSHYDATIVPFHKDFSPSGEQLEHHKLVHEL